MRGCKRRDKKAVMNYLTKLNFSVIISVYLSTFTRTHSSQYVDFFTKVIVEEFEEKVIAYHNKAMDDEAGFQRAAKASQKAATRKNKQKINAGRILSDIQQADSVMKYSEEENILCTGGKYYRFKQLIPMQISAHMFLKFLFPYTFGLLAV